MNESIKNIIVDELAPILITTPYVGKYQTSITLVNTRKNVNLFMIEKDKNGICSLCPNSIDDIKNFILESIFNIQESMIIYNDIGETRNFDGLRAWILMITVVKGNQTLRYVYGSDNPDIFDIYLKKYANMARRNDFVKMADEISKIESKNNLEKVYKIKSSRKSLL